MWCNALNEYLLDTDGQLSLSAILDKGLSLYSAADARTRSREVSMSRDELIFRQNILNIFCKKQAWKSFSDYDVAIKSLKGLFLDSIFKAKMIISTF